MSRVFPSSLIATTSSGGGWSGGGGGGGVRGQPWIWVLAFYVV